MTKCILIAILLTGFLTSCTTQEGIIGCDGIYRYSQSNTQTDSLWVEHNGVDCENCDEIN